MCAILGAAIGAMASVMQGMAQKQMADYQAKVAKINADIAVREGFAQAGATRDQFDDVQSSQTAALAKAGVDVQAGTAGVLGLETTRRTEHAAAVDIWRGRTEQTSWLNEAEKSKAEGKAAMMGGILGGISGIIGGIGGGGASAQGIAKPLSLGAATPAPVIGIQPGLSSPFAKKKRIMLGPY